MLIHQLNMHEMKRECGLLKGNLWFKYFHIPSSLFHLHEEIPVKHVADKATMPETIRTLNPVPSAGKKDM